MFGASLCCEHAQDASTTSDIENGFALEQMGVVDDSIAIRSRSYGILQHFLMNTYDQKKSNMGIVRVRENIKA